jgi:hypothetical protein
MINVIHPVIKDAMYKLSEIRLIRPLDIDVPN